MVDMLLTGFDAPVEQVLYLDRPLREHGSAAGHRPSEPPLLAPQARRGDGEDPRSGSGTTAAFSHDLEQALSSFDWPDVQDTMQVMEEDPATVIESAAVRAESHFKGQGP